MSPQTVIKIPTKVLRKTGVLAMTLLSFYSGRQRLLGKNSSYGPAQHRILVLDACPGPRAAPIPNIKKGLQSGSSGRKPG